MKLCQTSKGCELRVRDARAVKSHRDPLPTVGRLFGSNPASLVFDFRESPLLLGTGLFPPIRTALVRPPPVAHHPNHQQTEKQQPGLSSHGKFAFAFVSGSWARYYG